MFRHRISSANFTLFSAEASANNLRLAVELGEELVRLNLSLTDLSRDTGLSVYSIRSVLLGCGKVEDFFLVARALGQSVNLTPFPIG